MPFEIFLILLLTSTVYDLTQKTKEKPENRLVTSIDHSPIESKPENVREFVKCKQNCKIEKMLTVEEIKKSLNKIVNE